MPDPAGEYNEIIIISSKKDKPLVEPVLSGLFSNSIHTPHEELEFNLKFRNPWELNDVKEYGNIIITALDFPYDSTGDLLIKRFLKKQDSSSPLINMANLYVNNQTFCIVHALDAIQFDELIKKNKNWILNEFRISFENRMIKHLFKNGKNQELSTKIQNIIGYTVDLQPDFKLIKSDSLLSFIWVGRGYPYRWLLFHKGRKDNYTHSRLSWEQLERDLVLYIPEIEISRYFQKNEIIIQKNKEIPIMRGIYEHSESESGGPFFVYIFETEQPNEVILISGFVNHPGHEKLLLLKQLEIMAKTLYNGEII